MALTRKQKRALADALIHHTANLCEMLGEIDTYGLNVELAEIAPEEAAQQLADWIRHLPGDSWDTRLPDPSTTQKRSTK